MIIEKLLFFDFYMFTNLYYKQMIFLYTEVYYEKRY